LSYLKNAANTFSPQRGRKVEPDPVEPLAGHHIGRVDREGDHLKDHLSRPRGFEVRDLNAARYFFGHPITLELDLLQDTSPWTFSDRSLLILPMLAGCRKLSLREGLRH
jgi:hypothetical protein